MGGGTAIGAARGSCRCATALISLAVVWVLANGPVEGAVLWTFDRQHGLTTADLLVIPMIALGSRCLLRSREAERYLARLRTAPRVVAHPAPRLTSGALPNRPQVSDGLRQPRLSIRAA